MTTTTRCKPGRKTRYIHVPATTNAHFHSAFALDKKNADLNTVNEDQFIDETAGIKFLGFILREK